MKLIVTTEQYEQLFDPSKRPVEVERARLKTLRRGQELRRRSLEHQQERANACD